MKYIWYSLQKRKYPLCILGEEDLLSPVLYSSYDTPIGEPRESMWKGRQCLLCNKKFNTKQGRVLHERVHTGEKPYTCDYCGKAFAQKGNLKKHTESHTKQGQFYHWPHLRKPRILSPLCSLRVRNKVDLVPLACKDAVAQKGNLKKHTKSLAKHGR